MPTRPQPALLSLVLAVLLLVTILVAVTLGSTHISLLHPDSIQQTILLQVRLPRVLAAALVGAALSVSGLMFQGLFRNPMADPYIIGASGGAALGAAVGIVFFSQLALFGISATAALAFTGAVLTMFAVYSLARTRGRTSSITLLLAGFALGTMLANSVYLFEAFAPSQSAGQTSGLRVVETWLRGSISIAPWPQLAVSGGLTGLALLAAWPLMRRLNVLSLGDEYADQLGLRVEATRVAIILVGSLLTAIAVSLGGLISFAGLIVPHVARLLLGPDHVRLLPVTALAGAIFLVFADTLARTLFAPNELPVGILMVFLGGPFFLYLLRQSRREYSL